MLMKPTVLSITKGWIAPSNLNRFTKYIVININYLNQNKQTKVENIYLKKKIINDVDAIHFIHLENEATYVVNFIEPLEGKSC